MPNYVPGEGSFYARLMVIAEAPGKTEDEYQRPLIGPTGELLNDILAEAEVSRNELYLTNVVKYRPPLNDFKQLHLIGVDLAESIRRLWDEEIHKIRPNCILALGNEALKATTGKEGITNYRGSILLANDGRTKVVPSLHPAVLFPKHDNEEAPYPWVWKKIITEDIKRAIEESKTQSLDLPHRELKVAHSSLDVFRFFQEYPVEEFPRAANDIESINCIPVCTGFAFTRHHALCIPLLRKIGGVHLTDMSLSELADCWQLAQEALLKYGLVGQNFSYDSFKQRRIGFRIGRVVSELLLKAHTIFPELPLKKLSMLSSLWTREPFYKDDGKEEKIGKKFDVEKFFKYNARDCAVEFEVDEEMETDLVALGEMLKIPLKDFFYNFVMKKHEFYTKLEETGWLVDQARKNELDEKYKNMHEVVHRKLTDLIGYEVNTKSPPQVYKLLYEAMRFPRRKIDPTSEDSIVALMGNHCKGKDAAAKIQILETILEDRRVRDQRSRNINFVLDYDGRCRTGYNKSGTETSRTSTGVLKKPIRPKKMGLSFHTISKHGRLAKDIRSMFIADPGYVIVQVDKSQAEARVVAVLAEDWELLKGFDTVDIHRRTAALFFGLTPGLNLKPGFIPRIDDLPKDGPIRFTGKTFRHAGNYDMGKRRAMNEYNVNSQKYEIGDSISEWKAGVFLDLFHGATPKIRNIFHRDIRLALDSSRTIINPFGRPRIFNAKYDEDIYKEGYAQIPQSTVADSLFSGAWGAYEEFGSDLYGNCMFVSENHDSLTILAPEKDWERYAICLKKHQEQPIDFSTYCTLKRDYQLVIPADVEMSPTHFAALEKVKLEVA